MSIRTLAVLTAMLCAAPPTILAAQQVADSTRGAPASAPHAQAAATDTSMAGPRIAQQAGRLAPATLAPRTHSRLSYLDEGGSHTFTISTLALVLGIIIIVLLVR